MKAKPIIITIISVVAVFAVAFGSFFLVDYLFSDEKPTTSSNSKENTDDTSSKDSQNDDEKVNEDKSSEKVVATENKKGKTLSVPIEITKNPGFMASFIEINYDNSVLEYTGYKKGDILKDYNFSEENGKILFVGCENQDIKKTGTIFYLQFKIKDKSATQTMLEFEDAQTIFANSSEKTVNITLNDIKISLK